MRRRKGDVIINPWVSKEYCGNLNPCYATIYIGNGKCIDYRGRKHAWCGLNDDNPEREYKTVGHIDIDLKDMILKVLESVEPYREEDEQDEDWYDKCYECTGYGDNYSMNKDGELVSNCDDCPFNSTRSNEDD